MARFTSATAAVTSVKVPEKNGSAVKASRKPDAVTGNRAAGFAYKDKAELFLLAISNFTGQKTAYESADARDKRYRELVTKIAQKDPAFVANLLRWLRSEANIRTAAITGAVEYGRAVCGMTGLAPEDTPRKVLVSVMQRADEPSEALGYYMSRYGRKLPHWMQRALGDGAVNLYTERSVFKYDSKGAKVRFGDVIQLSTVETFGYKADVFRFAMDRRYNAVDASKYPELSMLQARTEADSFPVDGRAEVIKRRPELLEAAGYTWESLSGWLGGPLTKAFWEAMIPNMGYMALIRNLRNFAQAGIGVKAAEKVAKRIADVEEVATSRQLPLRFLSAYRAMEPAASRWNYTADTTFTTAAGRKLKSMWQPALDKALDATLSSVPTLSGQTVIMVDCSGSMSSGISDKSSVTYYDNAVAFGVALALANPESVLYGYSTSHKEIKLVRGGSLLDNIESFRRQFPMQGGTNTIDTAHAVTRSNKDAARLVILTDEQTSHAGGYGYGWGGPASGSTLAKVVPESMTCVTFNLAGYDVGHAPAGRGNFHTVPGLNDSGFQMLSMVDSLGSSSWPWEIDAVG